MARIHGRNGALYAAITSGGTAEPIAFLDQWSLNFNVDFVDVTAFGDSTKVYVAGLPDTEGSFNGFYDTATAQLYTAATDGIARKVYLYPDRTSASQYWYGTALFDFSISVETNGAVGISGNFRAASSFAKVG